MLCSKCGKNPASVFYKQIINGSVKEAALCAECASAMNIGVGKASLGFSSDLISGLFGDDVSRGVRKVCPLCGASYADIAHSGKVGCTKCYETFRSELMPKIAGIHCRSRHVERAPAEYKAKIEEKNRIGELEKRLSDAVKNEEYEKAAEIRDELRRLRG